MSGVRTGGQACNMHTTALIAGTQVVCAQQARLVLAGFASTAMHSVFSSQTPLHCGSLSCARQLKLGLMSFQS